MTTSPSNLQLPAYQPRGIEATHRMLAKALAINAMGAHCVVFVDSENPQADFSYLEGRTYSDPSISPPHRKIFLSKKSDLYTRAFSWNTMTFGNLPGDPYVFVDPTIIEKRFSYRVMQYLHVWNLPNAPHTSDSWTKRQRGTGRTTRMLEYAETVVARSHKPVVINADSRTAARLNQKHVERCTHIHGVNFEFNGTIDMSTQMGSALYRHHGPENVLFDHYVFEKAIPTAALDALHAYDPTE